MRLIGKCYSQSSDMHSHWYLFNRPDTLMLNVKCKCGDRIDIRTIQSYRTFNSGKLKKGELILDESED